MERYKNLSSGIYGYEIGSDYIKVQFKSSSKVYKYSYRKAGHKNVDSMKLLAIKGSGLNGYINSKVKDLYD
ncbi:hypothetical protein [Flavobacterium sp.]|uniref:hypothetical protein n=1 Tax=Flavobacterium sp. TaxID=239 RepID=UPI0037516F3B